MARACDFMSLSSTKENASLICAKTLSVFYTLVALHTSYISLSLLVSELRCLKAIQKRAS